MGKASWGAALGWLFCLLTGKVYAQGLPAATQNAQELQRQQQREQELRQKLQVQPDIRLPVPDEEASQSRLPVEETPCFKIERIIDPAVFNLKYWMVPPYRDDGNHRYEKTDTGSPV